MGPSHRMQSLRNRLFQRGSPTGSQALPANLLRRGLLSPWVCRSWQEPDPAWAPHGFTASFRLPHALVWGPFHGLQVDLCSTVDLHGLQGDSLAHHGLYHRRLSAPIVLAPPPPAPSSLTLGSAELFLPHHLTPLSTLLCFLQSFFLPLLKHVITEALPLSLIGLALASGGSNLARAGTGFVRHGGSFSQLLTEATPIAPHYQNLAT